MFKKNFAVVFMVFILIIALGGCMNNKTPVVEIVMEDGGVMVLELYPKYAPETVENFLNLVEEEFYDGLVFHRISKGFMIQGGDPDGNGMGGSGKNIVGEFAENGFDKNTLKHTYGVISMARSSHPDSASSQFFIMHGDEPYLDGKYAAFGKLIEGEDVLDRIADTPCSPNPSMPREISKPDVEVKISTIRIKDSK